ncbi:FtsX-like permease family protein [Mucilaginibacter pocheonensis]|uniref:Lipoprotein-releasing system permease protein n=1 Tax=Mucilaginibacter pocheonensis TaxID=398050 RepID=A0ABU1T8Z6_9SPHI|nr:FtsX-like permease family protein [Mucilaginibacter pocheonensis]MDR6941843.1 lipoprotein-releasing system permease protein [Mucilaginibacter pocheonensis]
MNTSVYIAKRYLFSGKKMHVINIISGISMLGVLIGSAALIIILSVFNGFEKVILSLYSNFTPEIKIEAHLGKTFDPNTPYFNKLHTDTRLISYTQVLQEKVLIKYGDRTFLGTIKGVSDDFLKNKQLDSTVSNGSFTLKSNGQMFAVVGATIQANLGINVHDSLSPLQIFSPRRGVVNSANPLNEFVVRPINASGVFAIQQEFDDILVTPIEFARELLDQPKEVSSIELTYKRGTNLTWIQNKIKDEIGNKFTVKNRKEQNTELYKTLNYERWSIFMILTFVLIIAIFNIIGSLTMLVIDKRKDIAILSSLGANKQTIQGIFFFEGMMISLVGCVVGILLGLGFCLLQQHYGLIKMGAQMSVIDAYPIDIDIANFGLVFLTVTVISVIAAGISARLSIKGLDEIKQDL